MINMKIVLVFCLAKRGAIFLQELAFFVQYWFFLSTADECFSTFRVFLVMGNEPVKACCPTGRLGRCWQRGSGMIADPPAGRTGNDVGVKTTWPIAITQPEARAAGMHRLT